MFKQGESVWDERGWEWKLTEANWHWEDEKMWLTDASFVLVKPERVRAIQKTPWQRGLSRIKEAEKRDWARRNN